MKCRILLEDLKNLSVIASSIFVRIFSRLLNTLQSINGERERAVKTHINLLIKMEGQLIKLGEGNQLMKFKIIKSLKREIYKNKKKQFSMEAGFRRMWLMFICLFKTYIFLLLHNHRVKNIIIKPVNSTQNMFIEKISH